MPVPLIDFCLLLRERRCVALAEMQDATLEIESNIMAAEKLKITLIEGGREARLLLPLLHPQRPNLIK